MAEISYNHLHLWNHHGLSPQIVSDFIWGVGHVIVFLFSLSLEMEIFFKLVFTHQCLHKGLFKIRAWQRVDIVGAVETGKGKPGWISVNRLSVRAELVNCGYLSVPRKTGNHGL